MRFEYWLLRNMGLDNCRRFVKKIGGLDANGCLLWAGGATEKGYGVFAMRRKRNGKPVLKSMPAPRAAWELLRGPIPKGLFVYHKCDNPPCINVDHLFLGTPLDNFNDMIAKGRHPHIKAMVVR